MVLVFSQQHGFDRTTKGGEQLMSKLLTSLQLVFARATDEEEGQGLTEYALILALIAVVAIAALHFLSSGVNSELTSVATSL
jgi:pilus assembly protein Flp/PilA